MVCDPVDTFPAYLIEEVAEVALTTLSIRISMRVTLILSEPAAWTVRRLPIFAPLAGWEMVTVGAIVSGAMPPVPSCFYKPESVPPR